VMIVAPHRSTAFSPVNPNQIRRKDCRGILMNRLISGSASVMLSRSTSTTHGKVGLFYFPPSHDSRNAPRQISLELPKGDALTVLRVHAKSSRGTHQLRFGRAITPRRTRQFGQRFLIFADAKFCQHHAERCKSARALRRLAQRTYPADASPMDNLWGSATSLPLCLTGVFSFPCATWENLQIVSSPRDGPRHPRNFSCFGSSASVA
jgi:hypothetical protein